MSEIAREQPSAAVLARINWPLLLGSLIVLLVVLTGIAGPAAAPRDPLEETRVVKIAENRWETPPFPAFTVPGFPLGSDRFGRDTFSRLLWAVRPTMIMVTIVAAVRLLLGSVIGIVAGWSTGRTGRALDTAITGALAVPALMVALGGIAAVGVELGIWAFIIGLSITGWAETARLVREQTRAIRSQVFVEAARALGSSDFQILALHVARAVAPMVWMLFSFEVSSTLMTTAGLGFLGYYVGGDVWIEVQDYVARRVSGAPELGQMLATSWELFTEPWGMVAVGSVVFIAVLGFNLLAEGLRQQLSLQRVQRRTILSRATGRAGAWVEDRVLMPVAGRATQHLVRATATGLLVLIIGGGLLWWRTLAATRPHAAGIALDVAGGHFWATERHDAYGTRWAPLDGPATADIQWEFEDSTGFSGGPAVAANGTVYVATKGGSLSALAADGTLLWQAPLPAPAVGSPALSPAGDIYVADREGGLAAFSPDGQPRWAFQSEAQKTAITGPTVAPDGTIYYPVGSKIQAVSAAGDSLWIVQTPYAYRSSTLRLDPTGAFLFWDEVVVNVRDGSIQTVETPAGAKQHYFLVGADGRTYFLSGVTLLEWDPATLEFKLDQSTTWNVGDITVVVPQEAGVTPEGTVWLYYARSYLGGMRGATRVVWGDMAGRILTDHTNLQPLNQFIGLDQASTAYLCGGPACLALRLGTPEPVWQMSLPGGEQVNGGALAPGRLYVTTAEGYLFAIGPAQP